MTHLLERAFKKLSALPEAEQNQYAAQIIKELEDEALFDAKIAATTEEQWAKMAARFREDDDETMSLSDLLKEHDIKL